jgi:AAA domain, putative AbiEii toxin, Type IV TA system
LPPSLHPGVNWPDNAKSHKSFQLSDGRSEAIFGQGVYVYFPSSRAELPYWLNRESQVVDRFDVSLKFGGRLSKPIFVENGLQAFAQWLMSVLVETRREIKLESPPIGQYGEREVPVKVHHSQDGAPLWDAANQLLRGILKNGAAQFVWFGRRNAQKIGIAFGDGRAVAGLDGLSAGQASLLLIFGTLLRYADLSAPFSGFAKIKGICIVDEIDSHLHIELQTKILPELIAMFPNVQFIVSSHSPLFALAMEKRFGADGMRHFDLDTGTYTSASAFSEFAAAFEAIAETEQFENSVLARAQVSGRPLILLEGETDPLYIRRAAAALDKAKLLETVELQWVGEKQSGNATNTGKTALNHAFNTLRSNPNLTHRSVLLLYDCDTNKPVEDLGNLHVRAIPKNENSTIAKDGIENLLPDAVFSAEMYDISKKDDAYGGTTELKRLNKMRLCETVCAAETDVETFRGFEIVFEIIEGLFPAPPNDGA